MRLRWLTGVIAAAGVLLSLGGAPGAQADDQCTLTSASMSWGLKASYRDYISGPVARGSWMASNGATATSDLFEWTSGTGNYDPQTGAGLAGFVGSVTFTAHAGVLATTIENPELQFVGPKQAYLLLDVTSKQRDGTVLTSRGVQFATLDLSSVASTPIDIGQLKDSEVPAVLTKAGATAFGGYEEGESLDPVTFELKFPAACAVGAASSAVSGAHSDPGVLGWLVLGLGIVAIITLLALLLFRRRTR